MSLSRLRDRNKLVEVSKFSEDFVCSWCDAIYDLVSFGRGTGPGERDVARPLPLELIRGGERERLHTLRSLSFLDARDRFRTGHSGLQPRQRCTDWLVFGYRLRVGEHVAVDLARVAGSFLTRRII